jgi:hypothetical protein
MALSMREGRGKMLGIRSYDSFGRSLKIALYAVLMYAALC